MSLSVGIVGLPNVGKSTLFNALLKKQQAYAANFPFATIEPNIGVVPVVDPRLETLANIQKLEDKSEFPPPLVYATVEFVDIAGLVAGAHKGEGLGNKFLSHIREVDAICHVVRVFKDENIIREGSTNPKSDFETIKTELDLADLEMQEKREKKAGKQGKIEDSLPLFSKKPILIVLNVDESDLRQSKELEERYAKELGVNIDQVIAICAKTESELVDLSLAEQKEYLHDLGVEKSGLERLIQKAYKTLDLMSFLTCGTKEVRAWTIKNGSTALTASGTIHTDFMKKFIKADIISFEDFVNCEGPASPKTASRGGWKACRDKGKIRSEGSEYIVKDGDVIEFKIGR